MKTFDCPLCAAPNSCIEHLAHGWHFCAACARCFLLDEDGKYVRSAQTTKAPQRKAPFNPARVRSP